MTIVPSELTRVDESSNVFSSTFDFDPTLEGSGGWVIQSLKPPTSLSAREVVSHFVLSGK